ncbi:hypothetical protein [Nocardia vinacea]|uniref:hypothetical protein n=1 Tax=Nocardia vinacea TaxID=96468 RepID=UPI003AF2DA2B
MQGLPLVLVEAVQHPLGGLFDELIGLAALGASGLGDGKPVFAPVRRIAGADDETGLLQAIDQPDITGSMSDPEATVIVVEHRDRLTRFGIEHLTATSAASDRQVAVLDGSETIDDLVQEGTRRSSLCAPLFAVEVTV